MGSRLPWEQESPSSTLGTPTFEWGAMYQGGDFALQARWVGFDSLALHQVRAGWPILAAVAERMRREFPKLVDAGSSPAGSLVRARVAQGKSDTRGEGLMRVQISSRAPAY